MEPFTFSRSVQVCIEQNQVLFGWLKWWQQISCLCMAQTHIVQQNVFYPSAQIDFYQIHLMKVHSTTALLNGSAKSERGEYTIIIKIWFASVQSRTAQLCFPMEVCPGQASTIRIFSACPVFGHSYCWAMQGSLLLIKLSNVFCLYMMLAKLFFLLLTWAPHIGLAWDENIVTAY